MISVLHWFFTFKNWQMSGGPGRTICLNTLHMTTSHPLPTSGWPPTCSLLPQPPECWTTGVHRHTWHLEWTFASLHGLSLLGRAAVIPLLALGRPRCSAFSCKPFLLEVWLLPKSWWDCQELALWAREMTVLGLDGRPPWVRRLCLRQSWDNWHGPNARFHDCLRVLCHVF